MQDVVHTLTNPYIPPRHPKEPRNLPDLEHKWLAFLFKFMVELEAKTKWRQTLDLGEILS